MRTFLVAAALLALGTVGPASAQSSCAILFRDAASLGRASLTVQGLPDPPSRMTAAFPEVSGQRKSTIAAAALSRWMLLSFADAATRDAAMAALVSHADVVAVEAIRLLALDDPMSATVSEIPWNVQQVRAPAALAEVQADSSLIVAVIDTGADLTHPDLQGQLWDNGDAPGNASTLDDGFDQNGDGIVEEWEKNDDDDNGYVDDQHGYDFTDAPGQGGFGDTVGRDADPDDDQGHGTHVAGIVAARGDNPGVAPFVRLMPVRAAFSTGFGGVLETDDAAAAIVYAVDNGARVLNLSWGDSVESLLIRAAIDHAVASDVVVVAAAGNDGAAVVHWPAADPRVLAVGSATRAGERSAFSNHGVGLDLLAPGEESAFPGTGIVSLEPRSLVPEGRGARRGTSMAAPHVAGVVAIVLSRADRPDAARTRALLLDSAQRQGVDWTAERGHGEVDALAAVRATPAVVALWHGPPQAYGGAWLRADATVWGAALQRYQVLARHVASGQSLTLLEWRTGAVWHEHLVDQSFVAPHQGQWELLLRVETSGGALLERRRPFWVDDTPPQIDSLFARSAWRAADVHWQLGLVVDDAVSVRVTQASQVVFSHEGLMRQHLLQGAADAALAGTWTIRLRNAAQASTEVQQAAPPWRDAWPHAADLQQTHATTAFRAQPVWGETPSGRRIVWGQALAAGSVGNVQAAQVVDDTLQVVFDLQARGRPVGYADVDADGRADLLLQNGQQAEWWTTCATCEFPDARLASTSTERVLGLLQLDDDVAFETLLSSRDSLLLFDDATHGVPAVQQVLLNPLQQGFAFWGADAAASDLDGDGRIELVCGDGEGNVSVFEAVPGQPYVLQEVLDTQGSYAYDISAVPPDGFVVGRQSTRSVTGDGFDTTTWEFQWFRHEGTHFTLQESWPFVTPTGDLRAASVFLPGSPTRLLLVRDADLYVLQRNGSTWDHLGWRDGAAGDAPAVGDLQGNGTTSVVLRTPTGSVVLDMQGQRAPHALHSESLGAGLLRLSWRPGDASQFRVRRRLGSQAWEDLGETLAPVWVDSTAPARVVHEYEVQWIEAAQVLATSNRIQAQSQALPRLLALRRLGPQTVRCVFPDPMHDATLLPRFFEVRADAGVLDIETVHSAGEGRFVDLLLQQELPCDSVRVVVSDLRDREFGLLDPAHAALTLITPCSPPVFLVRSIQAQEQGFHIVFSEAPDASAALASTYRVTWNGEPRQVSSVQQPTANEVVLIMADELVGRGIAYHLQLDAQLHSLSGLPLQAPDTPYEVLVAGSALRDVFVAPNPVRPGTHEVVFAEAPAGTRIVIYTLEGQTVRILEGALGGAVRWDLRTASGTPVGSGTYLYVATDPGGRAVGRLVVIR